jgi:hypothetical protein
MSFGKMAMTGALGFAIGAGLMMMPNGNKWRKTVLREADNLRRAARNW